MDTKYPTLKRPKRKLCYSAEKHRSAKQLKGTCNLDDVDKMFDDLDLSSSSQQSRDIGDVEKSLLKSQMSPVYEESFPPEKHSIRKKGLVKGVKNGRSQVTDSKIKTSSPIEYNRGEMQNGNHVATPSCFDFLDDSAEKLDEEDLLIKKQNNRVADESGGSGFSSPPSLIKIARKSCHKLKNKMSGSNQDVPPNVPAVSQEFSTPTKHSASDEKPGETSQRARKDMMSFLEKLKLTVKQRPPPCYRKPLVKEPSPPPHQEPEDFFIVEDEEPLSVTITNKSLRKKRQNESKTEKESMTNEDEKESQQEPEKNNIEQESRAVNKKVYKKKKEANNKPKKAKNDDRVLQSPENLPENLPKNLPECDSREQEKPKKKRKSEKQLPVEEVKQVNPPDMEKKKDKPSLKTKTKSLVKTNLKETKKSLKTNQAAALKETRKKQKQPDTPKLPSHTDLIEPENTEELSSPADVEVAECEADGKKTAKLARGAGKLYPEVDENLAKRKRKQTSDWWMVSPQREDEKELLQTPSKKSKQRKEPKAAKPASVKAKKVESKLTNQKAPVEPSSENTDEEKNTKKSKKTKAPRMIKAAEEEPDKAEEEDDEQQENDTFKFTHKETTTKSGSQIFQEIYKSNKKCKTTRAAKQPAKKKHNEAEQEDDERQENIFEFTHKDATAKPGSQIFQEIYKSNKKCKTTRAAKQPAKKKHNEAEQEDDEQQENNISKFTHKAATAKPGSQIFEEIYKSNKTCKTQRALKQPVKQQTEPGRRRRKPPDKWWAINNVNDLESSPSQPKIQPEVQPEEPQPRLQRKNTAKQKKLPRGGVRKTSNEPRSYKPQGGALTSSLNSELSKIAEVSVTELDVSDPLARPSHMPISMRDADQSNTSDPAGQTTQSGPVNNGQNGTAVRLLAPQFKQNRNSQSNSTFLVLKSGPCSLLQLEEDDNSDDEALPSSKVKPVLNASDFYAPPLEACVLDKEDITLIDEWFRNLWFTDEDAVTVCSEQFDWYSHKGRALGLCMDLNNGSFCSGKMLLGSYFKKPLWVDHTATTIFNLVSGSVNVSINGSISFLGPGETFMVNCGSAYNIYNGNPEPAILFFTRIMTESLD